MTLYIGKYVIPVRATEVLNLMIEKMMLTINIAPIAQDLAIQKK